MSLRPEALADFLQRGSASASGSIGIESPFLYFQFNNDHDAC